MDSAVLYFMFHILNSLTHIRCSTAGETAQADRGLEVLVNVKISTTSDEIHTWRIRRRAQSSRYEPTDPYQ